ncbi:MAG TPA: carboxymuconolactone decarboxylase family protein [Pseudorhizobium sp.]|jgi:AhpD family alkylhydroperoxidase|nr:carboxymuconolactone decarboxylase family protein [Pseudorhizobium sp.]
MNVRYSIIAASLAGLFSIVTPHAASAGEAETAYQDIGETYGTIPGFFRLFSADLIAETWGALKLLQLNPDIKMDAKTRELIGVAVATQGDCPSCAYFHAASALLYGASEEEIRESIAVGAATRRLGVTFRKAGADLPTFKKETDLVLWGGSPIAERPGPRADFCSSIMDQAGHDQVGCD